MNTGDLVLFRGRGFIPWIIRLWTRSAWGHCGVLINIGGVPCVIEAQWPGGVTLHAFANRRLDTPMVVQTWRIVDVPAALARLGDTYSTKDALRAAIGKAGDHAGWTCAEFAAALLGLDHHSKGWTPQRLAEALAEKP